MTFANYTPFTRSKYLDRDRDCNLDCDLDREKDVPFYTGHSLFITTKRITLLIIVPPVLHRTPPNIWI